MLFNGHPRHVGLDSPVNSLLGSIYMYWQQYSWAVVEVTAWRSNYTPEYHNCDVTWGFRRLISPLTRLFVQKHVYAYCMFMLTATPHYWTFVRRINWPLPRPSNMENIYMLWRHHETMVCNNLLLPWPRLNHESKSRPWFGPTDP